jgi:2-desacetyl-2-hydroxyethyl bacteriochlorophyllide A dehydrogenase
MRSALYTPPRSFVLADGDEGTPQAGEVQVAVAYTGICGTDLHIFHGDMAGRVAAPAVIGHEMSGRVAALGEGVTGWDVGDPVTVMPLRSCGACPACATGHGHLCHRLDFLGIDSAGSLQGRWAVPAATLVRLPEGLSLRHAALVEPAAVAVHDVRRAGVVPGESIVVVGGGPIGVLIATVARHAGAEVLVVEPDAYRRGVVDRLGFTTLDPRDDVPGLVDDRTGTAGADVAFEVSGAAAGVDLAVAVLGVRGRLVMVAIHAQPRPVDLHRFFWRELSLVAARLYDRSDFEAAVELVADGVVPAAELISRVEPLGRVTEAFEALEAGGRVMKVLVDCQAP